MNGKLEEQILHTQKRQQILQPWTYITENPEIVLQKIEKQREKLTDSSSDSSSDRISTLSIVFFLGASCISAMYLSLNRFVIEWNTQVRSVCLKEQWRIGGLSGSEF